MDTPPARSARLVLVTPADDLLGVTPPLEVATPWWQEAEPVVMGARETFGVDGAALAGRIVDVVERTAAELTAEDRPTLTRFVRDLPERFRRVEEAGLPDTLVHGDFHPGNTRGDATSLVLLDWATAASGTRCWTPPRS